MNQYKLESISPDGKTLGFWEGEAQVFLAGFFDCKARVPVLPALRGNPQIFRTSSAVYSAHFFSNIFLHSSSDNIFIPSCLAHWDRIFRVFVFALTDPPNHSKFLYLL